MDAKYPIPKSDARTISGRLLIPLTRPKWALYRMTYIWAEKAPNFVPYQSQCMKNPAEPRDFCGVHCKPQNSGGWGGIRTPGGVAPTTVFKTAAFDRSAIPTVFQPTVLFAFHTYRCCSPLVLSRLRFACLADSYARPPLLPRSATHPKLFLPTVFQPTVLFARRT